jgi:hypothetical protein
MDRMNYPVVVFVLLVLVCARPVAAQSDGSTFQAGVQLAGAVSSEFDSTDLGAGGRVSWHPTSLLGVEAEVNLYPGDLADDPAFSGSRVEGLFGATVGPRVGRLRPFAKVRPGFLAFGEAPGPIACIAIFPPPLRCTLASGRTVFALDVGGGIEWLSSGRTFVRVDAGDRILRYPAPAIDGGGAVRDETFSSHDFRVSIGGGVRF